MEIISSADINEFLNDICGPLGIFCTESELDEAYEAIREADYGFTEQDIEFLRQVYYFSKKRRWRYGLNIKYISVPNKEEVFAKLLAEGIIYTIRKYGQTYVFIRKEWRQKVAELIGDM